MTSTTGGYEDRRKPEARQASDVMAFGQEIGRVLSDGRIVGRAEPYAKVFASSRAVKRAVGLVAWGVLEDIALDARIDDTGRLVAETNVRRIAEHLGLSKTTVHKHLAMLREHGFVFHEELRELESGRYETARYVIDPSACIERFTATPARPSGVAPAAQDGPAEPAQPRVPDSGTRSVYQFTGHGDLVQKQRHVDALEQHACASERAPAGNPAPACDSEPVGGPDEAADSSEGDGGADDLTDADAAGLRQQLLALGVAGHVAADLITRYPRHRLQDAVAVAATQPARNTAGWIVTALRDGWDLTDRLAELRAGQARRLRDDDAERRRQQQAEAARAEARRADGWSAAVSAALGDAQLSRAIALVTTPMPGVGRRSVPLACAQLRAWAAAVHQRVPNVPLADALAAALDRGRGLGPNTVGDGPLPEPPVCPHPPDLAARVTAHLQQPPRTGARGSAQAPTPTPSRPPADRAIA